MESSHNGRCEPRRSGLCLTRREREEVVIDTDKGPVFVKIVKIKGNQIRLLFDAPFDTRIMRHEVWVAEGQKFPERTGPV